ncbi:unnamed protein product [Victoria cruziana]
MVVLSNPVLDQLSLTKNQKPTNSMSLPVIDLSMSDSKTMILRACEEFGFFRVVNHGIPKELISRMEEETANFFSLPLSEKEKAGPANPFGYGNRRIGPNGDVGWIEYLLLQAQPQFISQFSLHVSKEKTSFFREAIGAYTFAVKGLACRILEKVAEELKIEPRDTFSQYLTDKQSDSVFRLNHYPPSPTLVDPKYKLIGFGEHTDPQILTVLRSNGTAGLEICLRDGSWLPVPPDPNSLVINVGDAMQVQIQVSLPDEL